MKRRKSLYLVEWKDKDTRWSYWYSGPNLTEARRRMMVCYQNLINTNGLQTRITRWVRP